MLAKFPREHEHRRLTASYNGTSYDVPIRRSLLLEIIPRSFVQFLPKLLRSIFVTCIASTIWWSPPHSLDLVDQHGCFKLRPVSKLKKFCWEEEAHQSMGICHVSQYTTVHQGRKFHPPD